MRERVAWKVTAAVLVDRVDDGEVFVSAVPKNLVEVDRPNSLEVAVFVRPGDGDG